MDSDWFIFAVDPYYDRRTGYLFGVNPVGSIMDQALSNDVASDSSWDGVWEWEAVINDKGWSVEMRIPFNQIRFPKKEEYVWGVNFRRIIIRKPVDHPRRGQTHRKAGRLEHRIHQRPDRPRIRHD